MDTGDETKDKDIEAIPARRHSCRGPSGNSQITVFVLFMYYLYYLH